MIRQPPEGLILQLLPRPVQGYLVLRGWKLQAIRDPAGIKRSTTVTGSHPHLQAAAHGGGGAEGVQPDDGDHSLEGKVL